ncbi:MAG: hypothetical protein IJT59_03660 [Desulfovibrionaceae bacterium]|nr:hypothetical protein [Desulfovibrionaceae bacterium]
MRYLFYVIMLLLCTTACSTAHKKPNLPTSNQEVARVLSPDDQMAEFIGNAREGASRTFMDTSYGTATVTAGRAYQSALNIPCREAYVQGSLRTGIAACKDEERGWILAPEIFGDGAYR